MIGFIYCRTASNDMRVAKSDRIMAQKQRCWDFAREHNLTVVRRYADQGQVHPVDLAPALKAMLEMIERQEERVVVLADHPYRLGRTQQIVISVIKEIENRKAIFLPIFTYNQTYLEKLYEEKHKEKVQ